METEEWRPVVGFEGWYEVSSHGRVRSVDRVTRNRVSARVQCKGRLLQPAQIRLGYQIVCLKRFGKQTMWYVHRLVAAAFIPKPKDPSAVCVNHIDGSRDNNCPGNLEWVTQSGNLAHSVHVLGLGFPNGLKLTEAQVIAIRQLAGSMFQRELAKQFGVSQAAISAIIHRKIWKQLPSELSHPPAPGKEVAAS